jgi:hypothetical protein
MPGKTARSNPQTPFGRPGMATAGRTSHLGFQPVQKAPIFVASSGFIGGIPVEVVFNAKSGEQCKSVSFTFSIFAFMQVRSESGGPLAIVPAREIQ